MSTMTTEAPATTPGAAGVPRSLRLTWAAAFGSLVAAFPIYTWLAFGLELDRGRVADVLSVQVAICYWLGFGAALLPLPGVAALGWGRRVRLVVLPYLIVSVATHLTWEGAWVALHEPISAARDQAWAYPWWGYIDGGDLRYFEPTHAFLMLEILSVINGIIGTTGLILLFRSRFADARGTLMVMTVAVVETMLTWYYFGTELLSGFENVEPTFLDLGVKFIFLNAPWLVFPWFVIGWGYRMLGEQLGGN